MNNRKLFKSIVGFTLFLLLAVGCASPEATSVPPTSSTKEEQPSDTTTPTNTTQPTGTPISKPPEPSVTRNCTLYPISPGDLEDCVATDCTNTYFNSNDTIAYSRPDWMGELPDDLLLSELSIPGTHDTMAWACVLPCSGAWVFTQSISLDKQLNAGIRVLDLRIVEFDSGEWKNYHGAENLNSSFDDVLRTVVDFLIAHPTETVLIAIDQNQSGDDNLAPRFEWYMDQEYRGKQYKEWVWQVDLGINFEIPQLGDVRGKIVILDNFTHMPPGYWSTRYGLNWSSLTNNVGWEMQAGFCNKNDTEGLLGFDPKFDQIRIQIDNSMMDPRPWYITGLNGSGLVYPVDVANGLDIASTWCDGMNERTYYYITSCFRDQCAPFILNNGEHGRLGIILMDFPGAGLIDAIIAHNDLPRLVLVVERGGPFPDIDGWGGYDKNYATIFSADIDGDGVDEQLGRANAGMEVWRFNAAKNSWVNMASGGPFPDKDGWDAAKSYATIHSADINGDGIYEILGRSPDGIEIWSFIAATNDWVRIADKGPFPDDEGWKNERNYAAIFSADIDGDGADELLGRATTGMEVWRFNATTYGWDPMVYNGPFPDSIQWDNERNYATIHSADIDGDGVAELLGRANMGMEVWRFNAANNGWEKIASGGPFSDSNQWDNERNYATIHSADIDGDGVAELLGRANTGMEVWRFNATTYVWDEVVYNGPFFDAAGWDDAKQYKSIHSADFNGDGVAELLGRALVGLEAWRFDNILLKWEKVCTIPK